MTPEPVGPSLRGLRGPYVVAAFGGWNDAGSAATDAVSHLADVLDGQFVFGLDPDDYYDFQVNRPLVEGVSPTERRIIWPGVHFSVASLKERDLVLITGPEPNMRWRAWCSAVVSAILSSQATRVILLGALLADTPHTRPVPVSGTASDLRMAERLGLELSAYEGPTGIVGVLADACHTAGLDVLSLWAAIPHYVAQPPCPKATLALLTRVEDLLDSSLELGELPELSKAWERGVNELAEEDAEVADYVATLEDQQDTTELPEASGDAIAAEFERYLRRRSGD